MEVTGSSNIENKKIFIIILIKKLSIFISFLKITNNNVIITINIAI